MKPLDKMINVEKAKLLHELFPQEIPGLLEYVSSICLTIQEDEQLVRTQWDNGLLTAETWLSLAEEVSSKIERYGKKFHTHSRLFADQLFDGYTALYMVHCMGLYTKVRQHSNPKFALAIDLFFNP